GSRSFAYIWWEDEDGNDEYFELSVILSEPRTVSIANGTLTLQLGSPTASAPWITLSEIAPSGITVTAGLRIVEIFEFITSRNSGIRYSLFWEGEYGDVSLVYADRAGRVSGSFFDDEEGMWILVNWDLRQGWNTVLNTETAAEGISVTGRPGNDFRWITSQW
ncbi:MAG: hypothetical protein FWB99_07200, partial [Treponema sp.]|nr:hypothetical protein [Treponema sp.]